MKPERPDFGHDATPIGLSWTQIINAWDGERKERYSAHVVRLVGLGWQPGAASYLAYEMVVTEDLERDTAKIR